jgi:competence protein ComEC
LDVGQGDSILISQGSRQILIDGGKDGKVLLEKLGKYIPFWDREIEMVIETHPDADHIGGLIDVFAAYKIDNVMKTKMQSDSQTFLALEDEIENEKSQVVEARAGLTIRLDSDAALDVIFPFRSVDNPNGKDTNAASVVTKLNYGNNSFLFAGDLPIEQEDEIVGSGVTLKTDVLKVGHHGSKYSSGDEFLAAVRPEDAIISVGKNNTYGHPNQEALQRLILHKAIIHRNDNDGDIVYACKSVTAKCELLK